MRRARAGVLLTAALLSCGDDDSNEPEDPFPNVAGIYAVEGTFDATLGDFEGTLELTQASQESGDLEGSLSVVVTLGDFDFNVDDDALSSASVSPTGAIAFTAEDEGVIWTFTGTASGSSINSGRHTVSDGEQSFSGPWEGERTESVRVPSGPASQSQSAFTRLLGQLRSR